jgi:hypothetical protein
MSDKFSISPTEIQRLDGSNVRPQPDFVVVEEGLGMGDTWHREKEAPMEEMLE